ncbi:MAG: 5-formyltetrahydrofolate cyclo-ligase [Alphaproteobacteria bacterium]
MAPSILAATHRLPDRARRGRAIHPEQGLQDIVAEKKALRALARARRAAPGAEVAARASAGACAALLACLSPAPGAAVSGYWPMGGELDVRAALHGFAARGTRILLPVVVARDAPLAFRRWLPGDALVPAGFGTSVPDPSLPEGTPEILLVPLLAFDARGFRLGHGGGYYDRTIAALRGSGRPARAVGVAFACQEMERVPVEEFDQRLDAVATERGLRVFAAGGA